jgi:signal peptidase I
MEDLWSKEVSLKPLREKHRAAYYALLGAAVALMAFILLIDLLLLLSPINPWFHSEVVISGSMEPNIRTGSMIVITHQDSYAVGDVITFIDPMVGKNTHRIVAIATKDGVTYYATKGDALEEPDHIMVPADKVKGKVRAIMPWLGYAAYAGFALILVPLALLVLYLFRKLRSRHTV